MLSQVQEQSEGVRYLKSVIEGRLTRPLLLVGQAGVGKRFSVLEAAKEHFCSASDDADFHVLQVDQGVHPDLRVIQPEEGKQEIGIEAIRDLIDESYSFPVHSSVRYFVVDGADRLTVPAANALLKTLEEPTKVARFFLLAESAHDVLPTIRSRCGQVRYGALSEALILAQIKRFESDHAKALVYARLAEGSVGRAISLWGSGRLRLRDQVLGLLKPALLQDLPSLFAAVDSIGDDLPLALRWIDHVLHDVVMVDVAPSRMTNLDIVEEIKLLRSFWTVGRIDHLFVGLRRIQDLLDRNTKILLPHHVKSLLAGVG